MNLQEFSDLVTKEGALHYRDMAWRNTRDPYFILLSEVMLQQTQVDRVADYYEKFVRRFPKVNDLAKSSFAEVLSLWSGLGYNRRAKWLQETAQKIVNDFGGKVPDTIEELVALPGIGHNTAAAICVYAFNRSEVFIETNIRTVYIYHLFKDREEAVKDAEILKIQGEILDKGVDPRAWYLSLMDYGTFLKKEFGNLSQKSRSYRKQSTFKGSVRQVRGALLKLFIQIGNLDSETIDKNLEQYDAGHRKEALSQLLDEGFLVKDAKKGYSLKK